MTILQNITNTKIIINIFTLRKIYIYINFYSIPAQYEVNETFNELLAGNLTHKKQNLQSIQVMK